MNETEKLVIQGLIRQCKCLRLESKYLVGMYNGIYVYPRSDKEIKRSIDQGYSNMQRAYKLELKHIEKINYKRLKELKMI